MNNRNMTNGNINADDETFDDVCRDLHQQMTQNGEIKPIFTPEQPLHDEQPMQLQTPSFDFNQIDNPDVNNEIGMFLAKQANTWIDEAKNRPTPKQLFGVLWHENELCILFADTNLGKSILAVQIADAISRGVGTMGLSMEATPQLVLYFDFELSDKQFEARYSNDYKDHYKFSPNLIRIEINPDCDIPKEQSFEDYLTQSMVDAIEQYNAKILIIDNLTYLREGTETAKDALPLMKQLKAIKNKYGLSILVLAHTPKRNLNNPITRNDLQGSKMLINFCDSCFAIGESSKDKQMRYIKQIKQRTCEQVYDATNVIVCEIDKPDNFLKFKWVGYGDESEHLRQFTADDRQQMVEQVKQLHQQGKSQRDIATELGIGLGTVNKYLKM